MVQKEVNHLNFIDANLKVVKESFLIVVIMTPYCFNHLELSSKFFSIVSSMCTEYSIAFIYNDETGNKIKVGKG